MSDELTKVIDQIIDKVTAAERVFLSSCSYSEALMTLAREKPSARDKLQQFAFDLDRAVEAVILDWQAGLNTPGLVERMMMEIHYCRTLYTQVSEKPLLTN